VVGVEETGDRVGAVAVLVDLVVRDFVRSGWRLGSASSQSSPVADWPGAVQLPSSSIVEVVPP